MNRQDLIRKLSYLRKYRKYLVALVIAYVAICAALIPLMRNPIRFSRVMRHVPDPAMAVFPFKPLWFVARIGRLRMGDHAPDFTLPSADGKSTVSLASFHGQKPVILIFGSYT
jgi:hypothetical protein